MFCRLVRRSTILRCFVKLALIFIISSFGFLNCEKKESNRNDSPQPASFEDETESDDENTPTSNMAAGTLRLQLEPKEGLANESISGALLSVLDHPEITAIANQSGQIEASGILPGVLNILIMSDEGGASLNTAPSQYGLKLDRVIVKSGEVNDLGSKPLLKTGSIKGSVGFYQGDSDLDVSGSDVYIPGTSFTLKTGESGDFEIKGLPPGTYPIYAQHSGYAILKLTEVEVLEGVPTDLGALQLSLSEGPEGGVSITPTLTKSISGKTSKIVKNRVVPLNLAYDSNAALMKISDEPSFLNKEWKPVAKTSSWTFEADGKFNLYVMYSDLNGLESSPYSDSVYVDTEAPAINSARIVYNWSQTAGRYNFADLVTSDSGSGIEEILISVNDAAFSGATWVAYADRMEVDVGSTPETKTVYFRARDFAGNESGVISDGIVKGAFTMIPALVNHDIKLFKKQSPFKIVGETTITGKFETEAGVTLEFDENSNQYSKLIVDGPFLIKGTNADRVSFVADPDAIGSCNHSIDLSKQSNDNISDSVIDYLTLQDMCLLRINGGSINHLLINDGMNGGSASYPAIIWKAGQEPLAVNNPVVNTIVNNSFLAVEGGGSSAVVTGANVSGITGAPVFLSALGTSLIVDDSVIDGGEALIESSGSQGTGAVTIKNSDISSLSVLATDTSDLLVTRNNINVKKLHNADYKVDNQASYTRNNITITGTNSTTGVGDLMYFSGARDHEITFANNNITCTVANNCRGAISMDLTMSQPASIDLALTNNHWTDKAPLANPGVGTCTRSTMSFVVCLDGGNGDLGYLDLGIGAYEHSAPHSGTPNAKWSGLSGNFEMNSPINTPSGRP